MFIYLLFKLEKTKEYTSIEQIFWLFFLQTKFVLLLVTTEIDISVCDNASCTPTNYTIYFNNVQMSHITCTSIILHFPNRKIKLILYKRTLVCNEQIIVTG